MSIDSTLTRRMTMPPEVKSDRPFVSFYLPWVVAGAGLIVYAVTLNHWVTMYSIGEVARVSGWSWIPETTRPLYWLVTWPLHWLSARAIPVGLNLVSAVFAALTLAFLARTVALLPHDRTEEQRLRERSPAATLSISSAWIPPVLAALACGLQLTFWENATTASGDMLDLLLFAYIIRCVLEFRVDERESWLFRASLVYGAGMTNNWAMVAFLPVFIVVMIWTKGVSFFNLRFLTRMFGLGLAGLSFYLLLPIVNLFSQGMQVGFWQGLHHLLSEQKRFLFLFPLDKYLLFQYERPLWVLVLPSFLPVLALGIRWPAYFGDPSKLGIALATVFFHVFHAALLLLCAWVALDPMFSPRNYLPELKNYGLLLLPLYYLGALSIGYYSGYFLLVFGARPYGRARPTPAYVEWLKPIVIGLVSLLLLVVPAGLIYRNWDQVRRTNGPILKQYTALLREHLPEQGAVLMSDDPGKLYLLQSALTQDGAAQKYLFVESGETSLPFPDYHRFLKRKYPQRWQSNPPKDRELFYDSEVLDVISKLAQSNRLLYLHPSFGYYFELFYHKPRGLVYELERYPTNTLLVPKPSPDLVQENEAFWKRVDEPVLQPLLPEIAPPVAPEKTTLGERLLQKAYIKREPNRQAGILGSYYSRALDFWGVELQRAGRLTNAAAHFTRAMDLNPQNSVAELNLELNHTLQDLQKDPQSDSHGKLYVEPSGTVEDRFGHYYRNWVQILNANGPFDEPTMTFAQGKVFLKGGDFGQAAQQFARVQDLVPGFLYARILLARLYLVRQMPDQALRVTDQIHALASTFPDFRTYQTYLLSVEASSHLANNNVAAAETVVSNALKEYPKDDNLLLAAAQTYKEYGCYSNELAHIDRLLELHAENRALKLEKAFACVQLKDFDTAIPLLTRLVNLQTNNTADVQVHYDALLYRAYSYLKTENWPAAQRDYEALQKAFPTGPQAYKIYTGLAEAAVGNKDTNAAIRNYHQCLANVPTNSAAALTATKRLDELMVNRRR